MGDLETLLTVQREASVAAFAHIYPPDEYPFPSDEVRELWRGLLADEDVDISIAEVEDRSAGVVSVGGEFLRQLYVLPRYQGRGVGSALHDFALERLRERGVGRAKLWTLTENWPARRFYENRGWSLTNQTRVVPFPPNPIDVQYAKAL